MEGIEWKDLDWKSITRHIKRLQNSIAKASEHGERIKVRKLQTVELQKYKVVRHQKSNTR